MLRQSSTFSILYFIRLKYYYGNGNIATSICENDYEKISTATGQPVSVIDKAELTSQVIKGSMCVSETVAHIVVEKCIMGSLMYSSVKVLKQKNRSSVKILRFFAVLI